MVDYLPLTAYMPSANLATDEALRYRARRAKRRAMENEQTPWEVEAMEYFKGRLDEIQRAFVAVMAEQSAQREALNDILHAIDDGLDERSESASEGGQPVHNLSLDNGHQSVEDELQEKWRRRINIFLRGDPDDDGRAGSNY